MSCSTQLSQREEREMKDGKSSVKEGADANAECIGSAVENCPASAITA